MQRSTTVQTRAEPAAVYAVIADLSTYPAWLDVVTTVEEDLFAPAGQPAWFVTLRAKVGPFARSKRLRVVRRIADGSSTVRFERAETDGRNHADWTMEARVTSLDDGSAVSLDLSYTGGLWSGPLDAVLGGQIDAAIERLPAYVEDR